MLINCSAKKGIITSYKWRKRKNIFYDKLNMKDFSKNKLIWKTVKLCFSDKTPKMHSYSSSKTTQWSLKRVKFNVWCLYLTQNAFFKKPKLRLDIRISFPSSNALTKIVWNLFGAIKAETTLKYSYFRE